MGNHRVAPLEFPGSSPDDRFSFADRMRRRRRLPHRLTQKRKVPPSGGTFVIGEEGNRTPIYALRTRRPPIERPPLSGSSANPWDLMVYSRIYFISITYFWTESWTCPEILPTHSFGAWGEAS